MKSYLLALSLAAFPATIFAEQTDPCAGLAGLCFKLSAGAISRNFNSSSWSNSKNSFNNNRSDRTNSPNNNGKCNCSWRICGFKMSFLRSNWRMINRRFEPVQASTTDYSKTPELKSWKSDNPWYGADYAKTAFAMRYAKQLQREQPDLVGRPFLDALSEKVSDTFGASR